MSKAGTLAKASGPSVNKTRPGVVVTRNRITVPFALRKSEFESLVFVREGACGQSA